MPQAVVAVALFAENAFVALTEEYLGLQLAVQLGSVVYVSVEIAVYAAIALALAPSLPKSAQLQTPLKQSFGSRRSAYGQIRTSGTYALFEAKNGVAYQVIALLDGESDSITRWYFNDDRLTLVPGTDGVHGPDGRKYEYGTSGDRCFFHTRLGLATETNYADITSAIAVWTAAHRGDGITSCGVICNQSKQQFQQEDFPNGLPQPGVAVKAQKVFDPRDGAQTQGTKSTYVWSDNPALCLLSYLTDGAGGMGLDYTTKILPAIAYWTAAADDCDAAEATSGQHGALTINAAAGATTVTLTNVTGLAGAVTINFPSEVVTVSSVVGSVVHLTSGLTYALSQGDVGTWSASGTEKRYRCAGVYQHDNAPGDVINQILASFDGWMAQSGDGSLVLRSGRYYAPTVTFADKDVIGYSIQHFLPDEQAVNEYIPSYTDADTEFTTVAADPVDDTADQTARGGLIRSSTLDLPWVPSASQAVRLAKRKLARSTQELRGTFTTNLIGMQALGERYIHLQIADNAALADVIVEITGKAQINLAQLSVTFPFTAADTTVDSGSPGAGATVPGVPVSRPVIPALVAPTITSLTPVYDDTGAGIPGARISILIGAPIATDVQWLVRWKLSTDTDWHESVYTDIPDSATPTILTGFVAATGSIDVQVAYVTGGGNVSPWSATSTVTLATPSILSATITASENLAAGDLVSFWNSSGAKVRRADATDTTKPAQGFVLHAVTSGNPAAVSLPGAINSAVSGLTPGAIYYLDASPGAITTTPLSGAGQLNQEVGVAADATHLIFLPKTGDKL